MWEIISIAVAVVVLALLAVVFAKKGEFAKEPDYRGFFIGGVIIICIYIGYSLFREFATTSGLLALGVIFMAMGLAHKDRWGKPRRKLTKKELKNKQILMGVLLFLVVLCLVLMLVFSPG